MQKTVGEIAKLIDGEVVGDPSVVISGFSGIKEAKQGDLTFVANSKYFPLVNTTKASAVIAPREITTAKKPLIRTANPSLAFANMLSIITDHEAYCLKGIHETAVIAKSAVIKKNVNIGPYAIIEEGVCIGENTTIHGGCYIGHHTVLGRDCLLYPNVSIRERIEIGDRVIIHSGTVIGSDGFGFAKVNGVHHKIPQIGTVTIEDDVEIGANVTIDRARFDKTRIGRGTKIDNLVQIAHNVQIGENCIIVAQVGISGSSVVEDNAILAGQAGIAGHLTIGEGAVVASQAGVIKSVPPHTQVSGYPAKEHVLAKRVNASLQRLPGYVKTISELQKRIEALEQKLNERETKNNKK